MLKMLNRLIFVLLASAGALSVAHADTWLSWSEFDQDGENIQIYLSRETGDDVGPVQKITHRGMNITPSLLVTPDDVWIAWVDRANRLDYRLRYARINPETQNLLESGTIATRDHKVYAPVFAHTATGIPVLAWSGLDNDNDEEISLAYFQSGRWGVEQRITQNKVPDTSPLFSTGHNGELTLSWETISNNEISIHSIALHVDFVTARSEVITGDLPVASLRQTARNKASVPQLPASLQARQQHFFMGSRATALQ